MLEQVISDKAGWTRVAFGDVVRLSKERTKDPEAAGYERVVGLEHIEPGDLSIRRWADIADGTTFTSVFKPGQVLFGKRRAYQRKVAVANFAGVCSGDIYVLEPSSDALMPELLPFICQTDSFFDHAVGTSAGSLSPRTNWKSLANFEFLLPPIQDQARLVEVFDSIKRLADAQRAISFNVELLYASAIDNVVERVIPNAKSLVGPGVEDLPNTVSLDGITNIVDCKHRTPKLVEVGVPMVAPGDIKWGALDLSGCKQIAEQDYPSFMDHISISHGDIILSRNQTFGVAAYVNDVLEFALGQDTIAIQPRDYSSEFIYLALRSTFCQRQIYKYSAGSTFGRINLGDIRKLRIPIVSDALEQDAIAIFQEFENKLSLVKRRHASSVELLRSTLSSTPLNERADA